MLPTKVAICLLALFLGNASIVSAQTIPNATDPQYAKQIQEWRDEHESRFKSAKGWLALIGHYWLKEGANTFGPGDSYDIQLPGDIQEKAAGTIQVQANSVRLETSADSGVLVDGKETTRTALTIDNLKPEADSQHAISIGDRIQLQLVRRNNRLAIRVRDRESQAVQKFQGKKWFPIDPDYAVNATFTPYEPPKPSSIVNVRGETTEVEIVGQLTFELHGQTCSLDAMSESPDDLFVIFKDKTNGDSTYGPGRFLNTSQPKDGKVTLDFNKSYNPPCAFSPHTLCPLPPAQNHLKIEITAGERWSDSH
jgi:uncharacterized protein